MQFSSLLVCTQFKSFKLFFFTRTISMPINNKFAVSFLKHNFFLIIAKSFWFIINIRKCRIGTVRNVDKNHHAISGLQISISWIIPLGIQCYCLIKCFVFFSLSLFFLFLNSLYSGCCPSLTMSV